MSNTPSYMPVTGYVALYDTGRTHTVLLPVVAIEWLGDDGRALVLNRAGRAVGVEDETIPGEFMSVCPTDWPEA